jgi:hypothetical protein
MNLNYDSRFNAFGDFYSSNKDLEFVQISFLIAVTADKRSLPTTIDFTIDDYINNVQLVSTS